MKNAGNGVSAKDKGTGKEQTIVIQPSSGLAKDEVERMVDEALQYAEEDKRKRTEAETRNQADTLCYTTEKLLSDQGDKVPADLKQEVEGKVAALKTSVQNNDAGGMQAGINELNEALQRLGQAVYTEPGAETQGETSPDPGNGEDQPGGTVEGEYREI